VYFITDQATVNLPAASTVGQRLILIDTAPSNANSKFTVNVFPVDKINDGSASVSSATSDSAPDALQMISDGNGNWWVYGRG
jgi:hypothetical protein